MIIYNTRNGRSCTKCWDLDQHPFKHLRLRGKFEWVVMKCWNLRLDGWNSWNIYIKEDMSTMYEYPVVLFINSMHHLPADHSREAKDWCDCNFSNAFCHLWSHRSVAGIRWTKYAEIRLSSWWFPFYGWLILSDVSPVSWFSWKLCIWVAVTASATHAWFLPSSRARKFGRMFWGILGIAGTASSWTCAKSEIITFTESW